MYRCFASCRVVTAAATAVVENKYSISSFSKVLVLVILLFRLLVSASTESSLGARNFIQKHIVKKRGRCRELLASKEVANCAP